MVQKGDIQCPSGCCFGLFRRRACWLPTWRGWIVLALLLLAAGMASRGAHAFLALNAPVPATVLVAEGWLPDYALAEARQIFDHHGYSLLVTTGGVMDEGTFLSAYGNYAEIAAATLRRLGLPDSKLRVVGGPAVYANRTYSSAVKFAEWAQTNGTPVTAVNVVSLGTHCRRSRLMFERALGHGVRVGVIAIEDRGYDPRRWWRASSGAKGVLTEGLGYLHTVLFFDPKIEHRAISGASDAVGDRR